MRSLEWAAYCATDASPYAQAVTLAEAGCFIAAEGGGGGAAQLMPAKLIRPALEQAVRAHPRSDGSSRLARVFEEADAAMGLIVNEVYRGSGAQMVAALED